MDSDAGFSSSYFTSRVADGYRVRSVRCSGIFHTKEGACLACNGLKTDKHFKRRSQRREQSYLQGKKQKFTRDCFKTTDILNNELKNVRYENRRLSKLVNRQLRKIKMLGLQKGSTSTAQECVQSEEKLSSSAKILMNLVQNLHVREHGQRYSDLVKHLFMKLYIMGGSSATEVAEKCLEGPSIPSVQRWIRQSIFHMSLGITKKNVDAVGEILVNLKKNYNITESVAFEISIDETAVQSAREYCARTDTIVGAAGTNCKAACLTRREHRENVLKGLCEGEIPGESYEQFVIGTDNNAYDRMFQYAEEKRLATMITLVVVNPIHPQLAPIPLGIIPTCNSFTAVDSENLFKKVESFASEGKMKDFGRCYGQSSDGDARRAKVGMRAMWERSATYGLKVEGWAYFGTEVKEAGKLISVRGIHNQDYRHNLKKVFGLLSNANKQIMLGRHSCSINHLKTLIDKESANGSLDSTGLRYHDWDRRQRKAMGTDPLMRILSHKAKRFFEIKCKTDNTLKGFVSVIDMLRRYTSIYMSRTKTVAQRVVDAAYCIHFLRIWYQHTKHTEGYCTSNNFLTIETYRHLLMSCHCAINIMRMMRDCYPETPFLLEYCGSDVCEKLFAQFGGMEKNKRVYTVFGALRMMERNNLLCKMPMEHSQAVCIQAKKSVEWKGNAESASPLLGSLHKCTLNDTVMKEKYKKGIDEAKIVCAGLGMKPKNEKGSWWTHPWKDDLNSSVSNEEEEHEGASDPDDSEDVSDTENESAVESSQEGSSSKRKQDDFYF